jgi:hypothetical protein
MRLPSAVALALFALSAPFPSLINEPAAAEARGPSTCSSDSYVKFTRALRPSSCAGRPTACGRKRTLSRRNLQLQPKSARNL